MRSVLSLLSDASATALMCAGRLLTPPRRAPSRQVDVEAELRGDDHAVADGLQRFTDQFLVDEGAVGLCRIEERHAKVMGGAEEPDHLDPRCRRSIGAAHAHATQAESRDLKTGEVPVFHDAGPSGPLRRLDVGEHENAVRQALTAHLDRSYGGIEFSEFFRGEAD